MSVQCFIRRSRALVAPSGCEGEGEPVRRLRILRMLAAGYVHCTLRVLSLRDTPIRTNLMRKASRWYADLPQQLLIKRLAFSSTHYGVREAWGMQSAGLRPAV